MNSRSASIPAVTHPDVPDEILDRLRSICLALPEVREELAWTGLRWSVRRQNFAHVLMIDAGWPPHYAKVAASNGPLCVMTFRSPLPEVDAFAFTWHPFFKPGWWPDIVGMKLDASTEWDEVAGLVTESYRLLAPKKLAALVHPSRD